MENEKNNTINNGLVNTFLTTLHLLAPNNNFLQGYRATPTETHYRFKQDLSLGNDNVCPFNVPRSLKNNKKERGASKRPDYEKENADFFLYARQGIISDSALKFTCLKYIERVPYIHSFSLDGKYYAFEGRAVFGKTYNRELGEDVTDACDLLSRKYKYSIAITLTYDIKKYGSDIIKAWKSWNKRTKIFMDALRRKWKGQYVLVNESTRKGYPHSHILFYTNEEFQENWHKIKGNAEIKFGKVYEFIKARSISKQFVIKKPNDGGTAKYFAKYMVKTSCADLEKICKNPNGLSPENRKALLTILMPKLTGIRRVKKLQGEEFRLFQALRKQKRKEDYLKWKEKQKEERFEELSDKKLVNPSISSNGNVTHPGNVASVAPNSPRASVERDGGTPSKWDYVTTFPTPWEIEQMLREESRRQAFLIELCTKLSVLQCGKETYIGTRSLQKEIESIPNYEKLEVEQKKEIVKSKCAGIGCCGCIVTQFRDYVLGADYTWFTSNKPKDVVRDLFDAHTEQSEQNVKRHFDESIYNEVGKKRSFETYCDKYRRFSDANLKREKEGYTGDPTKCIGAEIEFVKECSLLADCE